LVPLALSESRGHLDSTELSEPSQLAVVEFISVIPLKLISHWFHNWRYDARRLLVDWPVTVSQNLYWL